MSARCLARLDPVIHGRTRLGLMVRLAEAGPSDFTDLAAAVGLTRGNLSAQLRKLEAAGYLLIEKGYAGRYTRTRAGLTPKGREALAAYLDALRTLVAAPRCRPPP